MHNYYSLVNAKENEKEELDRPLHQCFISAEFLLTLPGANDFRPVIEILSSGQILS